MMPFSRVLCAEPKTLFLLLQEIDRQSTKITQLNDEMHVKDTEHKTTLDQLKKLTQHMPDRTPKKDPKKQKSTTFANLLL